MLIVNFDCLTPEIADSKTQFNLFDVTGVGTNGYGNSGNPAVGDVTAGTLSVLPYLSTATPYVVNVFASSVFPNTDDVAAVILGTDIGFSSGASIASGIYGMTYTVSVMSTQYTRSKWIYLDAVHVCCADALLAASLCGCADSNQKQFDANSLYAKIASIHNMLIPSCNDVEGANCLIKEINAICSQYGWCGCS